MSLTPVPKEIEPVSKVTFSPINTEALVVSIRTIIPKPGENLRMETPRRSGSLDSKKKVRSSRSWSEKSLNKSTMTDYRKEISIASQTSAEVTGSHSSEVERKISQQTPCLKHAAENISLKVADMPAEKVSLCNNCSKSMLSYIFVVQDFLDSLAKEICGGVDSQNCAQCMREQVRQKIISRGEESLKVHHLHEVRDSDRLKKTCDGEKHENSKSSDNAKPDKIKKSSRRKDKHDESKKYKEFRPPPNSLSFTERRDTQNPLSPNFTSSGTNQDVQNTSNPYPAPNQERQSLTPSHVKHNQNVLSDEGGRTQASQFSQEQSISIPQQQSDVPTANQTLYASAFSNQNTPVPSSDQNYAPHPVEECIDPMEHQQPSSDQNYSPYPGGVFLKPMERQQPNYTDSVPFSIEREDSDKSSFNNSEIVTSPFGDQSEGIVTPLSSAEREVYDSARNGAGWEGLSEVQERLVAPDGRILSEAFVTMCRNNAEALGCLVVGTSLLLTQTTRTLCVLVSDGVSMAFREPLSSIFHMVQTVRSLDSLGTTKLALLEQPELGISFDKLNIWRLKQFHKCVYLNPDTLVVQNCDELFNHEELSAVPDIGWPDCFNSGVFVFSPSEKTFWQLLEFSDKQGSYDGGDQVLLNAYFNSWSSDINKKLSFIYNLMANVSYTYTPAFKQFGRNVKIVQFHGTFKPWHVKFFTQTALISPASNVHPTYVEFVNKWIRIFKGNALRQLSQEIQSYADSQELVCAVELLRFFPLPSESEAEFFLTPPSVRLRLAEMKLHRTPKPIEETQRRKSAEFPHSSKQEVQVNTPLADTNDKVLSAEVEKSGESEKDASQKTTEENFEDTVEDNTKLPGAEVGNYQGMKKWEQGKMDYQGTDSSDSIIKRLEFLMSQSK